MYPKSLLRHLDLTTLQLLLSINEEGTLTRGAQREAIAVSAASKRLLGLEQAIGLPMFVRKATGMMPTAAGETMLSHARQMLLGAEKIHAELVEHVQRAQGFVRIAANLSAIVQHLPEDLSRFLKARKGVSVDLQDRCCEAVLQAVEDGSVDLGICSCCGASANLHFSPYRKDHLVLAMRHDHQLAKYRKIPFAAALDEEYIVLYGSNWISLGAQAAAHEAGRPLKIKVQVPSFDAICRMAQAGIGIGLIPYEIFAAIGPSLGLAAVELDDAWSTRSQQLIVRDPRQLSPAATALFKHLKESHPNECSRNLGRRHARRRQ